MEEEIWKDYPEYPDRYQVSNFGNVRSKSFLKKTTNKNGPFSFWTKPKILKLFETEQGYIQVRLMVDGFKFTRKLHRMVALTFIKNPDNLPCVNHKNSTRDDNRVENLEWCTERYNVQHSYDTGSNSNQGEKHPRALLNDDLVLKIKQMEIDGFACHEISKALGFKWHTIHKVLKRKNWTHVEPENSKWVYL